MKMKTMKIWRVAFAMLAALSLASCSSDEPDGKWDSMVWKAEVPVQTTDGVYTVLETGTEFTFSCQNYSSPWIEDALSNGEHYYPPREANDYHTITTDWFKAEMSGNKLKVVFEANKTAEDRTLQLTVTAGDIFYTFKFKQFPSDVKGNCQIRYSLYGVSQDLLNFYDINVDYLDANGQQQKEVITENQWLYDPEPKNLQKSLADWKIILTFASDKQHVQPSKFIIYGKRQRDNKERRKDNER